MPIFQNSDQETKDSFLFHAIITVDIYRLRGKSEIYSSALETFDLSDSLVQIYAQRLYAQIQSNRGKVSIRPRDEQKRLLVFTHETGPDVFIIPLAIFLGTAVTSGIIGNLAYDVLKSLYQITLEAIGRFVQRANSQKGEKALTEQEMIDRLEIRLETPDSSISVKFHPEKGIPPEFIELLVQRIQQYQEKNVPPL